MNRFLSFAGILTYYGFKMEIWLVASSFGDRSGTPGSAPPGRAADLLTSPRGITAARPPFFILRIGARPLGYIDFGYDMRLRCDLGES